MYQAVISKNKPKMQEMMGKLADELQKIRTGRANTGLVENIKVSYYGTQTPINQMASLTVPDPSSILITPWDQNSLGDIELAIRNSNIGINPVNDGKSIRIVLPALNEERRKELSKMAKDMTEETRIAMRNIRQEAWNEIKKLERDGKITEDDRYSAEDDLNKLIDEYNDKIEKALEEKEKELMKV